VQDASSLVGLHRTELPSRALLVELPVLRHNIQAMATHARSGVPPSPHVKAHKSVDIASMQLDAGAVGLTVATIAEAVAMGSTSAPHVLLANQVVSEHALSRLHELARDGRLRVAVDSPRGVFAAAALGRSSRTSIELVVEVDIGMGRGGVRSAHEAVVLARIIERTLGVQFVGVMGWEGHVATVLDSVSRKAGAALAIETLMGVVARLQEADHECVVIAAGGTNTFDTTGLDTRVTEIQAGTYALMDTGYAQMASAFRPALRMTATVVSRHGGRAVLDIGTKTLAATELARPVVLDLPDSTILDMHEEHAIVAVGATSVRLGDAVEVVPSYAAGTVNLHDHYLVIDADHVVDVWPIAARSAGL
jgi:D-serine deaminase-like pyridoxal phosphate-dependent protein